MVLWGVGGALGPLSICQNTPVVKKDKQRSRPLLPASLPLQVLPVCKAGPYRPVRLFPCTLKLAWYNLPPRGRGSAFRPFQYL